MDGVDEWIRATPRGCTEDLRGERVRPTYLSTRHPVFELLRTPPGYFLGVSARGLYSKRAHRGHLQIRPCGRHFRPPTLGSRTPYNADCAGVRTSPTAQGDEGD